MLKNPEAPNQAWVVASDTDAPKAAWSEHGCAEGWAQIRDDTDAPKAGRSEHGCAEGWMRKGDGKDAPKAGWSKHRCAEGWMRLQMPDHQNLSGSVPPLGQTKSVIFE